MKNLLIIFLFVILGVHALALSLGWYYSAPQMDIPMHIAGGLWVASVFFYVARFRGVLPSSRAAAFVFGVGVVALVGVLWEFYEFLADMFVFHTYTVSTSPPYLHFDTLKDLFDDLVGGSAGLWIFLKRKK